MRGRLSAICIAGIVITLTAGCKKQQERAGFVESAVTPRSKLADSVRLQDDTFSLLAKPIAASRNTVGQLAIADGSDRNVKTYDSDGRRIGTIGRAGRQAGEFTHLSNAQYFGDSLFGYDFNTGTMTIFSPRTGEATRTIQLRRPPYSIRVIDDSLLLYVRHPGQGGPLLTLARLNGRELVSFFDPQPFKNQPKLRFLSALYADAHDGVVFAGIFGSDTLHTFDYSGKETSAAAIPSRIPLDRLEDKLAVNGEQFRRADSTWFHDGIEALMGLVALDHGNVALQIASYDSRVGTDLLRARSEILVVHSRDPGVLVSSARDDGRGLLLGRDVDGAILIASLSNDTTKSILISRRAVP